MSDSASMAERRAALEKRKREIVDARDAELRALEVRKGEVMQSSARALADAEAADAARTEALDRALAADIKAQVYPLIAKFNEEPRSTAKKLTEVWRQLAHRAELQLDDEPSGRHIALAFLAAMGEEELARGGTEEFFAHVRPSKSVTRALLSGAGPAAVEEGLRELEAAIATALGVSFHPPDMTRIELQQAHGTTNRLSAACSAYDNPRRVKGWGHRG